MSDEIQIKIPKVNLKKIKENPWIIVSVVLGILVIIALLNNGFALGISANKAGQNLLDYYQNNGVEGLTLKSIEKVSGLYQVNFEYQGNVVPMYVTKDGRYIAASLSPLIISDSDSQNPTTTEQDIPKSDKPKVELFVMSHCPYGTQMEKGIIPVVKELENNIDFEIKFVNYAMHPTQGEVEEQLNQYCIQKEQNSKYLDYLSCFLEAGDGETCLSKLKIDTSKLKICTDKTDKEFDVIKNLEDKSSWSSGKFPKFMIYDTDNQKYSVQGSPTLIINGQKAESGRDAQSILNTICSTFTTKPEECNADMTSFGTPAPGFGFDTQGGSASTAGCGV